MMRLKSSMLLVFCAGSLCYVPPAAAQKFEVRPVAEKKVKELPPGLLHWTIETFPTLSEAQAAAGPAALAADVAGTAWLFTLGRPGHATPGGTKVAEIGPLPPIAATEYLLRINNTGGPPGARTPHHQHPGSESFYVISGRLGQKTPDGEHFVEAGNTMKGQGAGVPMEVFSAGTTDLNALVMFVVDAGKPFSSDASIK
jgi:hypothetical protein